MKSKMQSVLLLTAAILVVVTNVAEAAVQTPAYVRCGGDDGETPILEKLSVHGSRFSIDGIDFLINDGFSLRMGSDGEHVILSKDSTDVILGKIRLPRLDCKKSNAWKPRLETVSIDLDPGALAVKSEIPFGSCSTDNQYRTYRKTIIVGAVRNPAAGAAFTQQSRRYYSTEAACEKEAPPPNWIDLISNVGGAVFKFLNRATSILEPVLFVPNMKSLRCAGTGGECPPEASNVQVPQKPDSGPAGDEGKVANGKIAQAAG